ncbi:vanadium-dependent haloperoxidase [Phytohabitans aurantiacus]|jgi:hypothetical protein|uniref:Phosphatidic acid phosphatase type 2/haloperoxidase domain-containing protein n=1 Tax=Phytohabitans aurantiacus TaxID=3016789 RepID=A0ABQ5R7G2_9ACTN|nr:vanadium-dependent haloperoxidase [Phytohabitans aurantiacus]GLI02702.1 hypothetical protein Pa4123_79800 [Phytohabitans aurantiacus]
MSIRETFSRRSLLKGSGAALAAVGAGAIGGALATPRLASAAGENVVIGWNKQVIESVRVDPFGPGPWARSLAMVHTAMYDAWAAYDLLANGTRYGGALRRPLLERTLANKIQAMSYAAHRTCVDLYPARKPIFDAFMQSLGFNPALNPTDATSPAGVGVTAAAGLLAYRHNDGSNQLGNLAPGPYSDYTGYVPVNQPMVVSAPFNPATLPSPDQWQPLTYVNLFGQTETPTYRQPFWGQVTPFGLLSAAVHRDLTGPEKFGTQGYLNQANQLLAMSANLTERQKAVVSYWPDGPDTVQPPPPAHICQFLHFVSARDQHSLDQDVKLFFGVTNAMFDASIVVWDNKRLYNSVRPISAIRKLFNGQQVSAWAGPGLGTQLINGGTWHPYKPRHFPSPPFPAFISGHATFSAAWARVMQLFKLNDTFGFSVVVPAGSSVAEPGLAPASDVLLHYPTYTSMAEDAGLSRLWGGVHFPDDYTRSHLLGLLLGAQVWLKCEQYFLGLA